MKNLQYSLPFACSSVLTGLILAALCITLNPAPMAAQGCTLVCNDLITVEVPANSGKELLPTDLAEGDLAQMCPNGVLNTQAQINNVWQPASGNIVFDASKVGQTILTRIRDQVTGNSCWGNVQVVAAPPLLDTVRFQLCAEFWKDARPMKGATLIFQPSNPAFPYSPFVVTLDSSHACTELAIVFSDYLPGTTFSYSASLPDTAYLNGVNIVDLCKISEHILGINPLPSPYAMFAADANKSGSITTFDIIEYRKLIEGVYKELPNNDSWRFISDYCTFPNPNNPFQNVCQTGISDLELAALDGDTAKVIGIKIGDVDGDALLPGETFIAPQPTDSLTLLLPFGQLTPGVPVAVPVKFDKGLILGSLQAQFFLDPNLVQFDSISEGQLDVSTNGNVHYNPTNGLLNFVSLSYLGTSIQANVPLFYIHLKPLAAGNLDAAIKVIHDDPNVKTFATGSNCGIYYTIGSAYSGSVSTYSPELRGLRVQPPSPNPFSEQSFLTLELENAETALLEVSDLMGRIVFSEEKDLLAGTYRWEIPATAVAPGSLSIWRLRVGRQMASGKLIRQ